MELFFLTLLCKVLKENRYLWLMSRIARDRVICDVVLLCGDGKERTLRQSGVSKKDAERKLLTNFPKDKVVSSKIVYRHIKDYGWYCE